MKLDRNLTPAEVEVITEAVSEHIDWDAVNRELEAHGLQLSSTEVSARYALIDPTAHVPEPGGTLTWVKPERLEPGDLKISIVSEARSAVRAMKDYNRAEH